MRHNTSMALKDPLVFIDTNIFLDAYRARKEAGLKLLERIDGLHDQIITSYQVEMEFKHNRQRVLVASLKELDPSLKRIDPPAFLSEAATVKVLQKSARESTRRVKKLKDRLQKVLAQPTTHDPVYKVAQRLFSNDSELNLNRSKKIRQTLRRLAFKRFILGYPPRKKDDTSIGDALNWEWMVHCAARRKCDVAIVSRDSDYGVSLEKDSFINDWLQREFKDRVSKRRKVVLTPRLSEALKMLSVAVSKEEESEEADVAEQRAALLAAFLLQEKEKEEELRRLSAELLALMGRAEDTVDGTPDAHED